MYRPWNLERGHQEVAKKFPGSAHWETRGRSQNLPTAETLAGNLTSEARVGGAEVWGRPTRKRPQEKNREQENLALGKMTPGRRKGMKGSATKTPKSKQERGKQQGKVSDIRMFFEAKEGTLGPFLGEERSEGKQGMTQCGQP